MDKKTNKQTKQQQKRLLEKKIVDANKEEESIFYESGTF